jgi:flagellar biosynthesis regulator FlaF
MPSRNIASRAYAAAADNRSIRQQEADLFLMVNARLQTSRQAAPIARVRAISDNRKLWLALTDLVRDPTNPLPPETKAGIISIGLCVQRDMESAEPSLDFLISINKNIADGLAGMP